MAKKDPVKTRNFLNSLPGITAIVVGIFSVAYFTFASQEEMDYDNAAAEENIKSQKLNPSDFTTEITNKYTSLPVGRKLTYREKTEEGMEKVEITIPGETKKIKYQGGEFTTLIYRDKVWLDTNGNGKFSEKELIEDTRDYLAQNKLTGDLWYFGEDVDNYEDGELIDHDGSWLAGVKGASPGIWVKQNPQKGERYLQEYLKGVAEDTVDVVSLNATVRTSMGTFKNCLKTFDWTPLDAESKENKYYCTQTADGRKVNSRVLTVNVLTGERAELVSVVDKESENSEVDDNED